MKKLMTKKKQRKSTKVTPSSLGRSQETGEETRADYYGQISPETHLRRILSERELASFYKRFLDSKYCGEILSFWLAVEEYKRQRNFSKAAEVIVSKFLTRGAENEVNLDMDVHMAEVRQKIEASADKHLFDKLQRAAFQLQVHDSYPKFMASKHYRDYLGGLELQPPLTRTASVEHLYRYCSRAAERQEEKQKQSAPANEAVKKENRIEEESKQEHEEDSQDEQGEDRALEEDGEEIRMVVSTSSLLADEEQANEKPGEVEETVEQKEEKKGEKKREKKGEKKREKKGEKKREKKGEKKEKNSNDDAVATASKAKAKGEGGEESASNGKREEDEDTASGASKLESAAQAQDSSPAADSQGDSAVAESSREEEKVRVQEESAQHDDRVAKESLADTGTEKAASAMEETKADTALNQQQETKKDNKMDITKKDTQQETKMETKKDTKEETTKEKAKGTKKEDNETKEKEEEGEAKRNKREEQKTVRDSEEEKLNAVVAAKGASPSLIDKETTEEAKQQATESSGSDCTPLVKSADSALIAGKIQSSAKTAPGDVSQKKIITVVVSLQKRLLALETKEIAHQKREKELLAIINSLSKRVTALEAKQ